MKTMTIVVELETNFLEDACEIADKKANDFFLLMKVEVSLCKNEILTESIGDKKRESLVRTYLYSVSKPA